MTTSSAVVMSNLKVTKRRPLAKRVATSSLCYMMCFDNGTQVSLGIPDTETSLTDGKNWTILTANFVKHITKDVACLSIVDGGARTSYFFDFISSLLTKDTSCSDFNFTNGFETYTLALPLKREPFQKFSMAKGDPRPRRGFGNSFQPAIDTPRLLPHKLRHCPKRKDAIHPIPTSYFIHLPASDTIAIPAMWDKKPHQYALLKPLSLFHLAQFLTTKHH
ncbi:Aspartic peptidase [Artemisia annua]|uniref:Aspartic peptidase n=1 Tax=Artemisia annua TaxID=35608 RepID=A0A2U1NAQ0_ARTAN|nr:Aspartic peptidase [Artemisia annua]